jgi:hypothetical protein
MRVRSRGFRRSADTGSRRASSACKASTPSLSSRARTASRTSAGIGGTAERPRVSALKYRPDPPMKIGRRFSARASANTFSASDTQAPAEKLTDASTCP